MPDKNILWRQAHDTLKISMQNEIGIMREILANMHQEELSLQMYDKDSWTLVMKERSELIEQLGDLRSKRIQASKNLEDLASNGKKGREIALEQMLPIEDENTCEILTLRDQIMALIERMNFQNSRNQILFHEVEHQFDKKHGTYPALSQAPQQKPKRKTSVATYPDKSP